jgi:phage-related protein (TIGR01555 family)
MNFYSYIMDWLFPSQRAALDIDLPLPQHQQQEAQPADPASRLDALVNIITGLGSSDVDKRISARPVRAPWLSPNETDTLFAQNGLSYRICRAPPYAAMRDRFRLDRGGERGVEAAFLRRLGVFQKFRDAAVMARKDGGCHLLKVTQGIQDLSEPRPLGRPVLALHVILASEAVPVSFDTNPESQNFGNPEFYTITMSRDGITLGSKYTAKVHYSHLIYFPGAFAPHAMTTAKRGYDLSVLDLYWEAIRDLDAGQSTLAGLLLEQGTPTLALANHAPTAGGSSRNAYALAIKAFMQSRSTHRLGVMSKEDQLVRDAIPLSGTREVIVTLEERCCSVEGIPMTVLWGQPPAGMTSDDESATRNWHALLTDVRNDVYEPAVYDLLVSEFGEGAFETFSLHWPSLDVPTRLELADIDLKNANRDKVLIDAKVITTEESRARYQDPDVQAYPLVADGMPDELLGPTDEEVAAMAALQATPAAGMEADSEGQQQGPTSAAA